MLWSRLQHVTFATVWARRSRYTHAVAFCWHGLCDWIIAVSLDCFVSLRTSSFRTNWYHLMPSSMHRHHWLSASILRASVLRPVYSDATQLHSTSSWVVSLSTGRGRWKCGSGNAGVENTGATKYGKPSEKKYSKLPDEISPNSKKLPLLLFMLSSVMT